MPAVIRVSAHYTLRDGVSSKLKTMAAKVTALETALNNAHGKFDKLSESAGKASDPLKNVNKQLDGMKSAIGTKNGTNGLLYRMNNLNKELGKLSKKDGHNVHLKTSGVKKAEADLDRLLVKASSLGAGKHTIKIDVDKDSIGLLREQASALDDVKRATEGVKTGFSHLKKGEAELRTTMRAKSQAAEQQRVVMGKVERQFSRVTKEQNRFSRSVRSAVKDEESFFGFLSKATKEMKLSESYFRKGIKTGLPITKLFTVIAAGANLAGVALGGLTVMIHGAITPIFLLTKQFIDMGAALGLLPALYGAVGLAVASTMGAMQAFFGPALKDSQKLSQIQKELDNVKDAKQRTVLMQQQKKLLQTMNPEQRKLAQGVVDLGKAWRQTFTSNKKLQAAFFKTAYQGLATATALLKRYRGDLQATSNEVRKLASRFFVVLQHNQNLHKGMSALFRTSRALVASLRKAVRPMLDLLGKLLQASEKPLVRIFNAFTRWVTKLDASTGVDRLEKFFEHSIDTMAAWLNILHNIGKAFHNIFAAGASENASFLQTLQNITAEFANWTGGKGFPLIQREFKAGMKVAKALGRFVVELVKQFMMLGGDGEAGKGVADFIDMLTGGLPRVFAFMNRALKIIGPSATRFFKSFGGFSDTMDSLAEGIAHLLDLFATFNDFFTHLPGPIKTLISLWLQWKVISFGLGHTFGVMFGSLANVVSLKGGLAKIRDIMAVIKAEGLVGGAKGAVANAFTLPAKAGKAAKASTGVEGLMGAGLSAGGALPKGAASALKMESAVAGAGGGIEAATAGITELGTASSIALPEVVALGGGLGGTEAALGGVAAAAGGASAAFPPLLIAIAAVAAIVGVAYGVFEAWQNNTMGVRVELEKTWKMLKQNFLQAVDKLLKKIGYVGNASDFLKDVWMALKAEFEAVGVIVLWLAKVALAAVMGALTAVIDIISGSIDIIKAPFVELGKFFSLLSTDPGAAFLHLLTAVFDALTMVPQLALNAMKTGFLDIGEALANAIGDSVFKVLDAISEKLYDMGNKVKGFFEGGAIDMATGAGAAFDNAIGIDAVGTNVQASVQGAQGGYQHYTYQDWKDANGYTAPGSAPPGAPAAHAAMPGGYGYGSFYGQQPSKPGKKPGRKTPASPQANTLAQMAVTGATSQGLTVNFDQGSLKKFNTQSETIKKNLDKLKVGKKVFSKPLNQAFTMAVGAIESGNKRMTTALKALGLSINKVTQDFINTFNTKMAAFGGTPNTGTPPAGAATPTTTGGAPTVKKHAQGGMVGGDTRKGDVVPIWARAGEIVLNPAQQRKLGGRAKIMQSLTGPNTANRPGGFNMQAHMGKHAEGGAVSGGSNPFKAFEGMFGLSRSSGDHEAPGVHAAGGYHYRAAPWGGVQAYDYGDALNPVSKLMQAASWAQGHSGMFAEEFYDKSSAYVKNGSVVKGQFGGHGDHLHAAFALGAAAAGAGGGFGQPPVMGAAPNLGSSRFGKAAQGRLATARGAMNSQLAAAFNSQFGGGPSMEGAEGDIPSIIRWAAGQYGADPEGLVRIAKRESNFDPNAWNKTDSNAKAGIPSKGLFQFIESTFNTDAAAAKGAKPDAWNGVPMAWLDPKAQSLAAAWAFANGHGGAWATQSAYKNGGSFVTNGPHNMVVGDGNQPERVNVQPLRTEAKPGAAIAGSATGGGGGGHTITNNFYIGVMGGDKQALQAFAAEVGAVIAKDLGEKSDSFVQGSRDVMTGNG